MTTVRILKDYDWPLMRQTPDSSGIWDDVQFVQEGSTCCDYTIILNAVASIESVICPPEHVWAIMQEPPTEFRKAMHRGAPFYHRIYTQDLSLSGPRYIYSHPALPWHVNKTYDELRRCPMPEKLYALSCITSATAVLEGQRARLQFLKKVRQHLELDLFGRGFWPIYDKWDGLAAYRYSLVIENFQNPYYWTEKLADCLLAWTMPLYIGCTDIQRAFPPEAVICLDMHDPHVIEKIRSIVSSDAWRKNLDAIAAARHLVLERYQLFPFLTSEIRRYEHSGTCVSHEAKPVRLTPFPGALQKWFGAVSHRVKTRFRHGLSPQGVFYY
jgi:hypothetical protein